MSNLKITQLPFEPATHLSDIVAIPTENGNVKRVDLDHFVIGTNDYDGAVKRVRDMIYGIPPMPVKEYVDVHGHRSHVLEK